MAGDETPSAAATVRLAKDGSLRQLLCKKHTRATMYTSNLSNLVTARLDGILSSLRFQVNKIQKLRIDSSWGVINVP